MISLKKIKEETYKCNDMFSISTVTSRIRSPFVVTEWRAMLLTYAILWLLAVGVYGAPGPRDKCDDSDSASANCKLPDCRCFGPSIPGGLDVKDVPQMVMLTFDDAVTVTNFDNFYKKTLFTRQNPNGCNISATFFVCHEYNDYWRTNELYRQGHEIALHSISHQTGLDYWAGASVETLEKEFLGLREILKTFGEIPEDAMKGMRAPFLQMAGDATFEMMTKNNLMWDCSWPTNDDDKGKTPWPYTLDFKSPQECPVPPCPTGSFPGRWVVPMVDWMSEDYVYCSMVDTCPYISDEDEILTFIKDNFHRHYDGNRAPFPFFIHAAWFSALPARFNAYNRFLDYLATLPDVYVVSISQVLQWIQNPTLLSQMKDFWKCWTIPENTCKHPNSCELIREDNGEERYMETCVDCPKVYPWLDNPHGDKPTVSYS